MRAPLRFLGYLLATGFFITSEKPSYSENYGAIPSSRIHLGSGFSPLSPMENYPVCIISKGECQTSANGAIACINGTQPPTQQEPLGIGTDFKVKQINSKYEFFREVNIQASLSGSYGPFSGSGSFSSFSLDDIKEDSLTWMVAAKSGYGSFTLIDPSLNASLKGMKPLDLIGKCGSSYVSAIDRGIIAAAIFSVYNLDEKHRREIRASLSAGFSTGVFDVNAAASFSDVMKTALQYGTMTINVYAIGGLGAPKLSDAIKANPTELDKIKRVLADYVQDQDSKHAAIVGFQTTGFGKLIGDPSIDPDQSNYVFYLENANEYRLRLVTGLQKVYSILERQADFDPQLVKKAQELETKLRCELSNTETAMQSCKMSFELSSFILLDGDAADDRAANLAQRYGMSGTTVSKRMQLCALSESAFAEIDAGAKKPREPKGLVTMGWMSGSSVANQEAQLLQKKPTKSCEDRLAKTQARLGEMIRVALDANENNRKKTAVVKPICITGCDFDPDRGLVSDVAMLPTFPFKVLYWFDALGSNFSSNNNPGLYVQISNAQNISEVRAYNQSDVDPFGVRVNSGLASMSLFFDKQGMVANQAPVRLEVETINGNTYTVSLPKIKLM
jgi:hypothetical protein